MAACLSGVNCPPRSFTISIDVINDLVAATLKFLENQRVQIIPEDVATLRSVVAFQTAAKIIGARRRTPAAIKDDLHTAGYERMIKHFKQAPRGIAVYLSCIGKFTIRDKKFYSSRRSLRADAFPRLNRAGFQPLVIFDGQ